MLRHDLNMFSHMLVCIQSNRSSQIINVSYLIHRNNSSCGLCECPHFAVNFIAHGVQCLLPFLLHNPTKSLDRHEHRVPTCRDRAYDHQAAGVLDGLGCQG